MGRMEKRLKHLIIGYYNKSWLHRKEVCSIEVIKQQFYSHDFEKLFFRYVESVDEKVSYVYYQDKLYALLPGNNSRFTYSHVTLEQYNKDMKIIYSSHEDITQESIEESRIKAVNEHLKYNKQMDKKNDDEVKYEYKKFQKKHRKSQIILFILYFLLIILTAFLLYK